jgi:hypothetical protein
MPVRSKAQLAWIRANHPEWLKTNPEWTAGVDTSSLPDRLHPEPKRRKTRRGKAVQKAKRAQRASYSKTPKRPSG